MNEHISIDIDIDASNDAYKRVLELYEASALTPAEASDLKSKLDRNIGLVSFSLWSAALNPAIGPNGAHALYDETMIGLTRQRMLLTYGAEFVATVDEMTRVSSYDFMTCAAQAQQVWIREKLGESFARMANAFAGVGQQLVNAATAGLDQFAADLNEYNNRHERRARKHKRKMKASDQQWKDHRR